MDKKHVKAVVTVVGKDSVGILAKVANACAAQNANVSEVTQSVLDDYFCMVMIIEIENIKGEISDIETEIKAVVPNMIVHVMHEDIFNSMHRI